MFWIACPSSCDCRAIVRLAVRVVMRSGLGRVRLLPRLFRIHYGCFVSFRPFSAPSPPCRLIRTHPIPSRFVPYLSAQIPLIASLPSFSSPITPRLSCRVSGADFLNASNSMPLKMLLRSGSSLLLADRYTGSMPPVGSSHHLIEYAPLSPCLPPPHPITESVCGRSSRSNRSPLPAPPIV